MKNAYKLMAIGSLAAGLSVSIISCDKSISEPQRVGYTPANADEKAGSWKTYVLTAPTDVTVAAPKATSSAAYQAELTDLKSKSASLTQEQQEAVVYWGAGAVYRWNEIARELAARYNIPPASTADGKYPVPDAANPLADPKFPFANPPYAARALAYLSVAQYDALVAAWNYKYQFKRSAPSKVDATVRVALPTSTIPAYPSEDAVVAAASYVVLKAMFPGEVPFLDAKLAEHQNSRLWAGMNVQSDLTAGADLGNQVAAKVMARAKTDGMSASNNQALTAGMIEVAKAQGLTEVWVSQESPIRPPMLPNYGAVTPWNFDAATKVKLRPGPPPALNSAEFTKALDELKAINKNQTREQARIANYWADGAGTYTPPGHWLRTAANAASEAKYSEVRMARTLALVGTSLMDAGICCWDTKYYYYYPRPQQFGVKTSVGLPNFPSYTSGHSTFSAAAATVLGSIFPDRASEFWAQAQEASNSRIYGLIHYRFDCTVGLECGKNIGTYAVNRGKADGSGL
ncbi:phosphatase PAP2 family protein [Spirosoma aerolatum]|uniref:phosphatase PAP2 family protein n=1 Tax=Spirosoma aerolatum TaxID=1211326 RepID=UPI0009AC0C07|nr:phosphatase PAP2 family protein [Spirosoma aerolatum]